MACSAANPFFYDSDGQPVSVVVSPPAFIVTIDTEEEGLWSDKFRCSGNTVANISGIPRFQRLCEDFGIRPTYVVDAPVVEDDDAVAILRAPHESGTAEIGAHVHPWCNPPFEEEITARNSYLCNLPTSLQREKIEWLTDVIEKRFGTRPTSFRAGRYGLDAVGANLLERLGYVVDSSVIPFVDYTAQGGPDFQKAPLDPYYPDDTNLCSPKANGKLLELPITVGFSRSNFQNADWIYRMSRRTPWRQLRIGGITDRLGIAHRIKLCPEQADANEMQRLAAIRVQQGAPCLVLMFHSSSLAPGFSRYVKSESALEEFYRRLRSIFQYCVTELECKAVTMSEFASAYRTIA